MSPGQWQLGGYGSGVHDWMGITVTVLCICDKYRLLKVYLRGRVVILPGLSFLPHVFTFTAVQYNTVHTTAWKSDNNESLVYRIIALDKKN